MVRDCGPSPLVGKQNISFRPDWIRQEHSLCGIRELFIENAAPLSAVFFQSHRRFRTRLVSFQAERWLYDRSRISPSGAVREEAIARPPAVEQAF